MTDQEKAALYSVVLRLTDDGKVLTTLERRDLLNQVMAACCAMTADDILAATENNRKLRIKRGTTTQNDAYTGLDGELTCDTTAHTLRIHDGQTPGGHLVSGGGALPENIDYVVEWQTPTAENNYTWYRKYASGWIEQGGIINSENVIFPIAFSNAGYTVTASVITIEAGVGNISISYGNKTTQSVFIQARWNGGGRSTVEKTWVAFGF